MKRKRKKSKKRECETQRDDLEGRERYGRQASSHQAKPRGGEKVEADPKWIRLAELFAVNDSFREKEGWHGDHSQSST